MVTRGQFTPEFKREAVELLESGSRPGSEITRDIGIARTQLYKWQTEFRARGAGAFPGSGAREERPREIVRPKRVHASIAEEQDILKNRQRTSPVETVSRLGGSKDGGTGFSNIACLNIATFATEAG